MEEQGWIGAIGGWVNTAGNVVTNLVLSGQKNRTGRELALAQIDEETQVSIAKLQAQAKNIQAIAITVGLIVAAIIVVRFIKK